MLSSVLTLYITHAYEMPPDSNSLPKVATEVLRITYENGHYHLIENNQLTPLQDNGRYNLGGLSITAELFKQQNVELQPEINKAAFNNHVEADPTLERLRHLTAAMPEPWVPKPESNDPLGFLHAPFIPQLKFFNNANQFPLSAVTQPENKLNLLDQHFEAPRGVLQDTYQVTANQGIVPQSYSEGNILRDLGFL